MANETILKIKMNENNTVTLATNVTGISPIWHNPQFEEDEMVNYQGELCAVGEPQWSLYGGEWGYWYAVTAPDGEVTVVFEGRLLAFNPRPCPYLKQIIKLLKKNGSIELDIGLSRTIEG